MNPLDWYGPEFLLFYVLLGIGTLTALWSTRHAGEADNPPKANLSDPYLIAFLRGGKNEALRVATVSLIDRGFLQVSGSRLKADPARTEDTLRATLEQQVFEFFKATTEAATIFKDGRFDMYMSSYERQLGHLDLLPMNTAARDRRLNIAVLVLGGVAALKIVIALSRGRTNIGFLALAAAIFIGVAFRISRPRLTLRGEAMLAGLRTLFDGLKGRRTTLHPGTNPNEVVLLAAVFGIGMLPESVFPHAKTLYPKAAGSGSSCGSSCGASCGSSCGGGGCGGGCGGCGS